MKQKRILLLIIFILAAAVALLAILHLTGDRNAEKGQVEIIQKGQKWFVSESEIARIPVKGELINGKGERVQIDAEGSLLADVLTSVGIDPAEVAVLKISSENAYSAEISGEELLEEGKVYLTSNGDKTFTLVVFGDSNSKRKVKNVVKIEVDP